MTKIVEGGYIFFMSDWHRAKLLAYRHSRSSKIYFSLDSYILGVSVAVPRDTLTYKTVFFSHIRARSEQRNNHKFHNNTRLYMCTIPMSIPLPLLLTNEA
jgi:hypothetical protein